MFMNSTMKSMWSAVEDILLEDSRLQISDQIFEGKKRRCLRFVIRIMLSLYGIRVLIMFLFCRYMGLASVLASQ